MSDGGEVGFVELFGLWEEGTRALAAAERPRRDALESVVAAIVAELRRRVGGTFTTAELARLYLEQGTDWCFELATLTAPSTPDAWDVTVVAGAAFARCARLASDFGGGRRVIAEE
jgi:hypothetical protein